MDFFEKRVREQSRLLGHPGPNIGTGHPRPGERLDTANWDPDFHDVVLFPANCPHNHGYVEPVTIDPERRYYLKDSKTHC